MTENAEAQRIIKMYLKEGEKMTRFEQVGSGTGKVIHNNNNDCICTTIADEKISNKIKEYLCEVPTLKKYGLSFPTQNHKHLLLFRPPNMYFLE